MGRIFFFLLLALAVYVGYRWWRAQRQAATQRAMDQTGAVERMVRCEVCGLNLPQSEALREEGSQAGSKVAGRTEARGAVDRWYCGEAHRRQRRS
ncbi:MAG: PP0621 family protein [Betaproteobacteria bacterium]|jgi:predicted negative regulator of RcsB-dependent stress response